MSLLTTRRSGFIALAASAALALTACAGGTGNTEAGEGGEGASPSETAATAGGEQGGATQVTDMAGDTVEVPQPAESVVATDNRIFQTLDEWDIELSAAPLDLMNEGTVSYPENDQIANLGNHREPDLEQIVAVEPDLVLNGQRFAQYKEDIAGLTPEDAALVDTDIDVENNPIDEELKQLTTLLGQTFDRQADAEQLNEDFDAAIERASGAYNPEETVIGLMTTGGDISYVAPGDGRSIGPVFDMLGLTPALERDGTTNHQGDDISVEAIAESNPDWILVMDRDAATSGQEDGYQPATELIENSEALQNVTAVQEDNIVYLPEDFYVHEDIQNYTEFLNDTADAFEGADN